MSADRDAPDRPGYREEALPHLDAVYRFSLRLTGSEDEAEDLVQETFLRAYRSWDQYTPGTNCRSWLFTIARNLFLRRHERARRHREIVEREARAEEDVQPGVPVVNPVWVSAVGRDPEGAFFESIVDERILEAVDGLPEEFRTAVVLADIEGLSYDEIAELMEVPVGTVKSRLFRGRRRLQEELWEYAVSMGYVSEGAGKARS